MKYVLIILFSLFLCLNANAQEIIKGENYIQLDHQKGAKDECEDVVSGIHPSYQYVVEDTLLIHVASDCTVDTTAIHFSYPILDLDGFQNGDSIFLTSIYISPNGSIIYDTVGWDICRPYEPLPPSTTKATVIDQDFEDLIWEYSIELKKEDGSSVPIGECASITLTHADGTVVTLNGVVGDLITSMTSSDPSIDLTQLFPSGGTFADGDTYEISKAYWNSYNGIPTEGPNNGTLAGDIIVEYSVGGTCAGNSTPQCELSTNESATICTVISLAADSESDGRNLITAPGVSPAFFAPTWNTNPLGFELGGIKEATFSADGDEFLRINNLNACAGNPIGQIVQEGTIVSATYNGNSYNTRNEIITEVIINGITFNRLSIPVQETSTNPISTILLDELVNTLLFDATIARAMGKVQLVNENGSNQSPLVTCDHHVENWSRLLACDLFQLEIRIEDPGDYAIIAYDTTNGYYNQ